jgi:hypothetical protein
MVCLTHALEETAIESTISEWLSTHDFRPLQECWIYNR